MNVIVGMRMSDMKEDITREFFKKRKKEIYDKWISKASQIPKDNKKAMLRF